MRTSRGGEEREREEGGGRRADLAYGHGAEDVEEDEGAVGVVVAGQTAVRQALHPGDGLERQFRHHSTLETEQVATPSKIHGTLQINTTSYK